MRTAGVIAAVIACVYVVVRWLSRRWIGSDRVTMFAQIEGLFCFLESDYGLRCASRTYDAQAFGNIVVRYEKPGLAFQLARDRSQWFFYMGTSETASFSENDLLPLCNAEDDLHAMVLADWRSLELVADVVSRRFTALVAVLGSHELQALAAERQRLREESLRNALRGS